MIEKATSLSVHDRPLSEQEQVAIALSPHLMGPLLYKVFQQEIEEAEGQDTTRNGHSSGSDVCRILDAKYEPDNYCTILYELGNHLVTGTFRWDVEEGNLPEMIKIVPPLGMRAYRFPNDPILPSLIRSLHPETISAALLESLPEFQDRVGRILRCNVTALRFRPGRRCTIRLSMWLREQGTGVIYNRVLYGKIYHDLEKAERVYQQMLSLSHSIPAAEGLVSFANASAFLPDLAMVLQEPIEGVPLDSFISCDTETCDPRGFAGIGMAGTALAAFHSNQLTGGKSRSIHSELTRFKKRGARIGQINSGLGQEIINLADALSAWLDTLDQWGARICLVHGDCKPSQFLIQDGNVALLDFDHCGMADPAVDVGTFLATLQQMQVKKIVKNRGRPAACTTWMPGVKQQFLEAYLQASGSPAGLPERAAWYEAVGLLRKAIRAFERSPFSPLPAALLAEAWKGLETLPPPSQS
jgi:aminoglycoside phosphotransferase (APT) family kinase protein